MGIFELPKIDSHCHVLDPARFPYAPDALYQPQGQETGSADYFTHVMQAYGVRHALLVGPNSGYGEDNRCLLDALARGQGRFKGVAVVPADCSLAQLQELQAQGVVGVAFNPALHGLDFYSGTDALLGRLQALGLWAQIQVRGDQLLSLLPRLRHSGARLLIDHCGRPELSDGEQAPGIQALLALAESSDVVVKLSGFAKFSQAGFPFEDTQPHALRLWQALGPERCIWASDWPYLRAEHRLDYGVMLQLAARWFTPEECQQMMWDTPAKLFDW